MPRRGTARSGRRALRSGPTILLLLVPALLLGGAVAPPTASDLPLTGPAPAAGAEVPGADTRERPDPPDTKAGGPGCRAKGTVEVCFSSPPSGAGPRVINRVRRLFARARAGDSLKVAMFRWDLAGAAEDLVAAQARGVDVELVVDREVLGNPVGAGLVSRIRQVTVCDGSCLPWAAGGPPPLAQDIQHAKVVVADVRGERSVVTTSSNLVGLQYLQYNSLLRVAEPRYYRFASRWFAALRAQRAAGLRTRIAKPFPAMVYPRRDDVLLETLRATRCVEGADDVDVHLAVVARTSVRQRLAELARSGCDVRVVVDRPQVEKWLEERTPAGRLPGPRVRQVSTHDKGVMIHAVVDGERRYVVVTGTSNTTCGGLLYNDELMLRLEGRWIHRQYTRHFRDAWSHARSTDGTGPAPVDFQPCRG